VKASEGEEDLAEAESRDKDAFGRAATNKAEISQDELLPLGVTVDATAGADAIVAS
jgi:hypothetical protein